MTTRYDLGTLVTELQRQKDSRIDVVIDSSMLAVEMSPSGDAIHLSPVAQAKEWLPASGLPFREPALIQLGERMDPAVPLKFIREMSSKRKSTLATLLNDLLHATGGRHMVRCLDNHVRALLSNKYRVLDNYDLAFTALEEAQKVSAQVVEAHLTDTKMRLKFVRPDTHAIIDAHMKGGLSNAEYTKRLGFRADPNSPPGTVHPYFTISNSETGDGGLNVEDGFFDPRCANGLVLQRTMRAVHIGSVVKDGIYSEETIAADSRAIMLKARDHIRQSFSGVTFTQNVALARKAAADPITAPSLAIDNLISNASLPDSTRDALLSHFLKDYSPTRYGLASAISRYAQDTDDADTSYQLESLAGRLLSAPELLTTK